MDNRQMPDTPWHIGFIKKDESDPRRHKVWCFYYMQGECRCIRSSYYTSRCPGSSHCSKYREDAEVTQDIREIQAEKKRAELYHVKMIKKRIEMEKELGEIELYTRYGKTLVCPVCGERLKQNKCTYCGFVKPEAPKKTIIVNKKTVKKTPLKKVENKKMKDSLSLLSKTVPENRTLVKKVENKATNEDNISGTLIRVIENGSNCPFCNFTTSNMRAIKVKDKEGQDSSISAMVCEKCGCIYLTRKLFKKLQMTKRNEMLNIVT